MLITKFIRGSSFGPEEIDVIVEAFNGMCKDLQLIDQADPLVESVAKTVVEAAGNGAENVADLQERALRSLKQ